jgi:acetyl esterase
MNLEAPPLLAADLAAALERIATLQKFPHPDNPRDVKGTRLWFEGQARLIAQLTPRYDVHVREQELSDESLMVTARIYRPSVQKSRVLFVHGGGWALGSLDTHDSLCRWLCSQSCSEVIALDYDLAPEQPFPRAVDQTLSGLRSVLAMSTKDGLPLLVMGDSAGADIASLAILRADIHEVARICGFVSAYGAFEPRLDRPSHQRFADGPFLRRAEMEVYWGFFAGQLKGSACRQMTPLDCDLGDFPATLCLAMECDLLRDDSLALHEKILGDGGVSTIEYWRGMSHGCLHFVGIVASVTHAAESILRFIAMNSASPKLGEAGSGSS